MFRRFAFGVASHQRFCARAFHAGTALRAKAKPSGLCVPALRCFSRCLGNCSQRLLCAKTNANLRFCWTDTRARVRSAIRREDKSRWERRTPLTPSHVAQLTKKGIKIYVQPVRNAATLRARHVF